MKLYEHVRKTWWLFQRFLLKMSRKYPDWSCIDFFDTRNYKVVTSKEIAAVSPRFSRDKSIILFNDYARYVHDGDPPFVMYDINNDVVKDVALYPDALHGQYPLWNYDNTGFFFSKHIFGLNVLNFYDFSTETVKNAFSGNGFASLPIGWKDPETLIVTGVTLQESGRRGGYYFMDRAGSNLVPIDNPHLEHINRDGINKKAAYNAEWDEDLELFVYAEIDSTVRGYSISVTNLDGSYYQSYTYGGFLDDHPVWGPNGESILFERSEIFSMTDNVVEVFMIDVQSGDIKPFAKGKINGAQWINTIDY